MEEMINRSAIIVKPKQPYLDWTKLDDVTGILGDAPEQETPQEILDLVQELRETEGSRYVEKDTPIFTCVAQSLEDTINSLGI